MTSVFCKDLLVTLFSSFFLSPDTFTTRATGLALLSLTGFQRTRRGGHIGVVVWQTAAAASGHQGLGARCAQHADLHYRGGTAQRRGACHRLAYKRGIERTRASHL